MASNQCCLGAFQGDTALVSCVVRVLYHCRHSVIVTTVLLNSKLFHVHLDLNIVMGAAAHEC